MTAAERSDISNGIWLCAACATLVDTDEHRFPILLLHEWKFNAEQTALKRLKGIAEPAPVTYFCGHCCYPVPAEARICPNCKSEVVWGSSKNERLTDFQTFGAIYVFMCVFVGLWVPEWINSAFNRKMGNIFSILSLPVFAGLVLVFGIGSIRFVKWRSSMRRQVGPRFFRYRNS